MPAGDILFLSPLVISGDEDEEPYTSDVLVSGGLISAIGPSLSSSVDSTTRKVQAQGLVLCPGFIDLHAHSDLHVLTDPLHEPKITQGITTELVGQDGISYYPTRTPEELSSIRTQIAGWNGNPSDEACATTHAGVGLFEWKSVRGYLDTLDRNGITVNVAVLVPQGNLRLLAVGPNDTVADKDQLEDQVALLKVAMLEGAIGMSSGLTYTPGMYASYAELARLCKTLATSFPGAVFAPHHRSYGKNAMEAYQEMLDLALETGISLHLTHCKLANEENIGRSGELLAKIDAAIEAGVNVSLDTYPYTPGSTTLASLLPAWANQGGPKETLKRLTDAELRKRIRHEMEDGCDSSRYSAQIEWDTIEFAGVSSPELAGFAGMTVAKVAEILGKEPIDVFYDFLEKDDLKTSILAASFLPSSRIPARQTEALILHQWTGIEESVREIMMHRKHTGGSDGILVGAKVHPRAWGTFPRFIGHYSRKLKLMSLRDMVAHLTSRSAKVLGIYPARGSVTVGAAADLVLFNPETIRDLATYEEPKTRCQGIEMVLVNGAVALEGKVLTGVRAGVTLRRRADGTVTARGH